MWAESSAFTSEARDYALFFAASLAFFLFFSRNQRKMGANFQEIGLAAVLPQLFCD
jgi:hypothetical protein